MQRSDNGLHGQIRLANSSLTPPCLLVTVSCSSSSSQFKDSMSAQSIGVQGSGWGWLGYSKERARVEILTKPNQDPLTELVPLLGFDVSVRHAGNYSGADRTT